MKIKSIEITNFKGIEHMSYIPKHKTCALIAPNGTGKTSFLEALRFGLTGDAPNKCIRDHTSEMSVSISMDGNVFSRTKNIVKPTKIRVNGKTTTAKNLDDLIGTITGLSGDALKITTSGEILAALKPAEFGDFIMDYIPEKLDFDTVCSYIPGLTPEGRDELAAILPAMPEKFGVDVMKGVQEYLADERKTANKELQIKKSKTASLLEKPARSLEQIEKELTSLIKAEGSAEAERTALKLYNNAVSLRESTEARIRDTEKEIADIKTGKPNPEEYKTIQQAKEETRAKMLNAEKMCQTIKTDIALFENTLANLEKPVCPLSEKLVCTTDKSFAKNEFLEVIAANKEGLEIQQSIISKAKEELAELQKSEDEYRASQLKYQKKITLMSKLEELKKSLPVIPEKPIVADAKDLKPEIARVQKERDTYTRYLQQQAELKELENIQLRYDLLNSLYQAVRPKGPVMDAITEHYLTVFETVINARATALKTGFEIRFVAEDGVSFLVQTNPGTEFRPYESLSNGEKSLVLFLLLDMLNSLCGTKLLLLDDLNHLDKESFSQLFKLIMSSDVQDSYDHIFICAVNNSDISDIVKAEANMDYIY